MQVGRYRIEEELGRGGMAVVYRAHDPQFNRDVALKVLPRDLLHGEGFVARFHREAQTIAALEHPTVVPVYDFGEDDGRPFLVMRYMGGGSLAERIRQGPFSLHDALQILQRLAQALDYVHGQGIIHRDLKPENILFDPFGHPYLSDFGIVKLALEGETQLTATGNLIGTPAYMSPEQVEGQKTLDGRSDVYALGVILYEMLAGEVPYRAPTPISQAIMHLNEPVPDILEARPELPAGVQGVLERALAKEPAQRFASTGALARALAASAGQQTPGGAETVVDMPPSGAARPGQPARLRFIVGGALAGVGILGVAALIFFFARGGLGGGAQATATSELALALATSGNDQTTATPSATMSPTVSATPSTTPTPSPSATATSVPTTTPRPFADTNTPPVAAQLGDRWTRPSDGMVMVYVPAGTFLQGSAEGNPQADGDETPQRLRRLDAFWLDRTEVTNAQFAMFTSRTGYVTRAEREGEGWIAADDTWELAPGADWRHPYGPQSSLQGRDEEPVVLVSYADAADYCAWVGGRLPTEAEWEYAARGPDSRVYPWGDVFERSYLNYCESSCTMWADRDLQGNDGYALIAPVGAFPQGASWVGALDMAGNVWEWVRDWYQGDYYAQSPTENPPGPEQGSERVIRGGGWNNGTLRFIRSAFRDHEPPGLSHFTVGFRCMSEAPGS